MRSSGGSGLPDRRFSSGKRLPPRQRRRAFARRAAHLARFVQNLSRIRAVLAHHRRHLE